MFATSLNVASRWSVENSTSFAEPAELALIAEAPSVG